MGMAGDTLFCWVCDERAGGLRAPNTALQPMAWPWKMWRLTPNRSLNRYQDRLNYVARSCHFLKAMQLVVMRYLGRPQSNRLSHHSSANNVVPGHPPCPHKHKRFASAGCDNLVKIGYIEDTQSWWRRKRGRSHRLGQRGRMGAEYWMPRVNCYSF